MSTIELFQKVTVELTAGAGPQKMDLRPPEAELRFIFGIGPGGLTPFEYRLAGHPAGTRVRFEVAQADRLKFFERLAPLTADLFIGRAQVWFTARVTALETPEPREIVRALAETAGQGGGCGCGCGCG
jgi:hypothetical protein